MSQRQTLSYLQNRFQAAGLQPQTKFGQNFLIDLNLVEMIANTAEISQRDVVLEVGTGMGSLTGLLAAKAGHVVTIEIDSLLAPLAAHEFEDHENVTLLQQDALKRKNKLHPQVVETLQEKLAAISGSRLKLVANLPYNVATPILSNLLDMKPWPTRMVATIQKELAQRIIAKPSTKDYSALSVWIQAQCKAEIVRLIPPTVFWPAPKVDSAILDIQPQKVMRKRIKDPDFFHRLVRNIFIHRRKFLRSALVSAVKPDLDKPAVDEIMAEMEFDAQTRAEQLTPQRLLELSDCVARKMAAVQQPE
ncbi:MAG: 16S rRNA (adenine(1518)-N(6)/adenine(1519)-N(6))-dimethyltransferase RsmA [Planctomycetota bacterium]|nr:16S rRNA (adenine(1518)-N(6)/adenine(1519)-N(6))-dimethyltransferase RsmA [Planctomycetota bacterium]